MKTAIQTRIDNYKAHRQECINKQNNHKWNPDDIEPGLDLFATYQEKEALFTTKIIELEWVLSLIESTAQKQIGLCH